jgi:hypothetical protein
MQGRISCAGNTVAFQSPHQYHHPIDYQQILVFNTTFRHAYRELSDDIEKIFNIDCVSLAKFRFIPYPFRNPWLVAIANHSLRLSRLCSGLDTCPS